MAFPTLTDNILKHNDYIKMIQIKKQMSLQQQRIFDTVLATVQEMKKQGLVHEIVQEGEMVLDYDIFRRQMLQGSKTKKINRKELQEAMETMVDIKFSYATEDEVGAFVIFQKARVNFEQNKLYITFGKDFRTDNLLPSANYTSLSLTYLNSFSSQYARALYQYFKMLMGKDIARPFRKDIVMEIEFYKKLMGINPQQHKDYYKNNAILIKRTVEPAVDQINTNTNITVTYEKIKVGKEIKKIKFYFVPKEGAIVNDEIIDAEEIKGYTSPPLFSPNFTVFKDFRKWLLDNFKGKKLASGPDGFHEEVVISLSPIGYLRNDLSGKDLDPDEAQSVWEWLFANQDKIGNIQKSKLEQLNQQYCGSKIEIRSKDGGQTKLCKIEQIVRESSEHYKIILLDESGFEIEVPTLLTEEDLQKMKIV